MSASNHPLFRKEVMEQRAARLHGDVSLAVPLSWQVIGFTLLLALTAALAFLATGSYSRVETVSGAVVLDTGVAAIVPSRAGMVAALPAREGQRVKAGDPLVEIRSEEDMADGGTAPHRILGALTEQDKRLSDQSTLMINAAAQEGARLAAQIAGLSEEITSLNAQIEAQRHLVAVAENEFLKLQEVARTGFISRRELEERESGLIGRRQQLSQLEQALAAKRADLAEARHAMAQARALAQAQNAGVQSDRAELAERRAAAEVARGYTITSPVDGAVTAVTARLGQPTNQQQALMVVVPSNAQARVELYVPTNAAGFLSIGQEVRLAVDAFPYQRFGTVKAHIIEVSSVAIPRALPDGETTAVYLVTAALERPSVTAFGREQPLLPGMALTARIVTERQTLLQWLFEPFYAVQGR